MGECCVTMAVVGARGVELSGLGVRVLAQAVEQPVLGLVRVRARDRARVR